MKKLLTISLLFASIGISSFSAEAKTIETTNLTKGSMIEVSAQPGRSRYRRPRVTYRTRYVRRGYALYKETLRYTIYPNGRTQVSVIRRIRVR